MSDDDDMNSLDAPNEGEDWLISYADMMTLIACFFILMMAFANYDPPGFSKKAIELSKHFNKDKYKSSELKMKTLEEELSRSEFKDRTKISVKDNELVVTFSSTTLFKNGSPFLESETQATLDSLIDILKISNSNYRILIEGHADDDLVNNKYNSLWELSMARAVNIAERFAYFGFNQKNIVPIAKGDHFKVVESKNEKGERVEGLAKLNRRVVIRVLEPYQKQRYKFGLGVYFRDATEEIDDSKLDDEEVKEFEVE